MRKKTFLLVLFCYIIFNAQSQNSANDENPVFNSNGLTYNSIIEVISDKNIPFDKKFKSVKEIEYITPFEKVTDIYNRILLQAKKEKEKYYLADLYSALANNYLTINKTDIAKLYLDSAFVYEKEITNLSSLALMNYIMSRYYMVLGEEDKCHDYLFRTISYFEKTEGKESTAILLLYNLSEAYYTHKDIESLKKVLDHMMSLAGKANNNMSYITIYSVATSYYQLLYQKGLEPQYQDSIMLYDKKIIDVYENSDDIVKNMIKGQVVQHYLNIAETMTSMPNPDWDKIIGYVETVSQIGVDIIHIGNVENRATFHRMKAKVLLHESKYKEALSEAMKSLEIMNNELPGQNILLDAAIYSLLTDINEKKGDYASALKYSKLKNEAEIASSSERKFGMVKDLQAKYDTAKKDLQISKLNEEKQRMNLFLALIVGGIVILLIIIFILFLYNRMKQMKLTQENQKKQIKSYLEGLESERYRLAKELHDNISNDIITLRMKLEVDNSDKATMIKEIQALHSNVRDISHELMPPIFKYTPLKDILRNYINQQNHLGKAGISVDINGEEIWDGISSELSMEIYRIIQEAVGNAQKYSEATHIEINLSEENGKLTISIKDNGIGFDQNETHSGLGLKTIKDRSDFINGILTIKSKPQEGTEVRIVIPA